ncbi:cytochrome c [Parasulfuritortus cantonensis]|uniref:Cytochrome c n=1 Tax=Parasulfuritortus cantonensis TaxID=2528202 RepID=A0A4R1BLS5_9PROT|nr:cytochrome c [Parasulfuritortus cantonensis]TCJ18400.1 cytochrome c [Parasulfuritortus cantonensis]
MHLSVKFLLLALAGSAAVAAQAADTDSLVKYRRNLMDANGGLMGMSNLILQNKAGDKAQLAAAAKELASLNKGIAALFPKGSASPDSDALPEVWSKRADFERLAKEAETKSAAFAKAPSAASFKDLSEACKSCHKDYRK